jgi:hypothetical protein
MRSITPLPGLRRRDTGVLGNRFIRESSLEA